MVRTLLLASIASLLVAGTGVAGQLAPKKPSETIVLTTSPFSGPCTAEQLGTQITADGNEVDFVLEPGKALMVTDIAWRLEAATPGDIVGVAFYNGNSDIETLDLDAEVDARGFARGREHFSTPIRMLDVICANPVVMDGVTIPQVDDLRVFGFITNDR